MSKNLYYFRFQLENFFIIVNKIKTDLSNINYIPYFDNNTQNKNSFEEFEEAMIEFWGGINSIGYKILFRNETQNIDDMINNIINDVTEYLNLMENLIKNEEDREYYFVFNDGIEKIAKLTLENSKKNKENKKEE